MGATSLLNVTEADWAAGRNVSWALPTIKTVAENATTAALRATY
jgi:hypothetical protein